MPLNGPLEKEDLVYLSDLRDDLQTSKLPLNFGVHVGLLFGYCKYHVSWKSSSEIRLPNPKRGEPWMPRLNFHFSLKDQYHAIFSH